MGRTFFKTGDIVTYTNPSASVAIAVDDVVVMPDGIGVALIAIGASGVGELSVRGIHYLPALSTDAWLKGDPLWWDATNEVLTRLGTPALRFAGTAAAAKAVTTGTRAYVRLNDRGDTPEALLNRTWEDTAANLALDAEDVGKVITVTADAKVITLPATAAGLEFVIRNGGADAAVLVNVDPNDADMIMGANWAGVDKKSALNTKTTAKHGDFIHLVGGGLAGYFIRASRGVWAAEA